MSLAEPKERIHFPSKVQAMDQSADGQRDFDAFVMSAKGETSTKSFQEWAGGEQVTLAIVFTDVVGLTATCCRASRRLFSLLGMKVVLPAGRTAARSGELKSGTKR